MDSNMLKSCCDRILRLWQNTIDHSKLICGQNRNNIGTTLETTRLVQKEFKKTELAINSLYTLLYTVSNDTEKSECINILEESKNKIFHYFNEFCQSIETNEGQLNTLLSATSLSGNYFSDYLDFSTRKLLEKNGQ